MIRVQIRVKKLTRKLLSDGDINAQISEGVNKVFDKINSWDTDFFHVHEHEQK